MEKFYYSKEGKTIIYQIGEYLYTIKGKPVAFLSEGAVFTINGHLLGYYGDGYVIKEIMRLCLLTTAQEQDLFHQFMKFRQSLLFHLFHRSLPFRQFQVLTG